ncbi:Ca2+ activated outward rectifying K+ channel 5 [Striga asiatica]|uniref:Ca2+ activated outward rectifying K+ channel 5 n=1 Tax=Striga asiatica TaxID=4170 RepID=A0A5A7QXD1_STRAF|nr:Ca2+ activated outward rectifying K+ channel 5 [Striga asiatica]
MNHIKQRLGSGSGLELLLPHGDLLRPVKADEEGEKGKQDRGKRGLKWRKLQTKPRPPRGRRSEPAARPGLHSARRAPKNDPNPLGGENVREADGFPEAVAQSLHGDVDRRNQGGGHGAPGT